MKTKEREHPVVKELIKPKPVMLGIEEVDTFCSDKEGSCGVDVSPEDDDDIILE
jgi:hypothetical protein